MEGPLNLPWNIENLQQIFWNRGLTPAPPPPLFQNAKNLHFWYMRASLYRPTHYDKLDQWTINTDKHWQVEGRTTSNKTESCARSGLCNRNWYHRYKRRVCKIQKWAICVGKRMVVCLGQSLSLLHCKGGIRENKLNFMTFAIKGVGVPSG